MQELIAAKPADLLSTYFRKALPFHPDVAEDREKASQRFWQLSEAYWRLAAGSSVVPQDFSEQAILELWLREFAFEESGLELPALIAKELQMSTALEREQRHYEACTLARGLIPGERLQCAICGFQVRYHEQMREHMGEHEGLRGFWADRAIKLSTQSLGRAGASDDSTFQPSDGSWVQFKGFQTSLFWFSPARLIPFNQMRLFCVGFEKYDQASQRTWSPKVTQTFLQHYAMWRCLHLQIGPAEIRQEPPADVDEFRTGADVDLAAVPRLL